MYPRCNTSWPKTALAVFLGLTWLGVGLTFVPGPAQAAGPVAVETIVSNNGEQWTAPVSPALFFASYAPPPGPLARAQVVAETAAFGSLFWPERPGSVLGPDGRSQIAHTVAFPYRSIVFLQVAFDGGLATECTGWLIGPRTVATAAHCVQDAAHGWARSARVYPGADGRRAPLGSAAAARFYTVLGWTSSHLPEFDYAALLLDTDLGEKVGWVGMALLTDEQLRATSVRMTGYPADKPPHTMWTMSGQVRSLAPLRVWYDMDSYAGQSGSPVYNAQSTRSCLYCVVAIHGYGTAGDSLGRYNSGVRITRTALDNFLAWRELPDQR